MFVAELPTGVTEDELTKLFKDVSDNKDCLPHDTCGIN